MRSFQRRFFEAQTQRPQLSSILNFARVVRGQNFTRGMIGRWFNQLVDKEDFEESDRRALLKFLNSLSTPEDDKKQG